MRHICSTLILVSLGSCSTDTGQSKEQALAIQALDVTRLGDSIQDVETDLKKMGFSCSVGIAHTDSSTMPAYPILNCAHSSLGECRLNVSIHAPGGKVGSTAITFERVSGPVGASTCGS